MSLTGIQLSGKVNKLPVGNTILPELVGSTPCEHSRYLKETRPMPVALLQAYPLAKKVVRLSPAVREGRQPHSAAGKVNPAPPSHTAPRAWAQRTMPGFHREANLLRHNHGCPRLSPPAEGQHTDRTRASAGWVNLCPVPSYHTEGL